jgi:hypothetical protein
MVWFGLWYLMPLSTIFQLYRGNQCNLTDLKVGGSIVLYGTVFSSLCKMQAVFEFVNLKQIYSQNGLYKLNEV